MVSGIETAFPKLQDTEWQISSKPDDGYNCIAWAAKVTTEWWWPVGLEQTHWPEGAPREVTLEAFREAFATLGYFVCESGQPEPGYEKIALFASDMATPRHAARQLPSGRWTSKLGKLEDIEHELHDLEGALYGAVVLFMKRPLLAKEEIAKGEGAS
jgi:hypothetical protein